MHYQILSLVRPREDKDLHQSKKSVINETHGNLESQPDVKKIPKHCMHVVSIKLSLTSTKVWIAVKEIEISIQVIELHNFKRDGCASS